MACTKALSSPGWNGLCFGTRDRTHRAPLFTCSPWSAHIYLFATKFPTFPRGKRLMMSNYPPQKAGLKQEHLLHSIDDPNEVILLFEAKRCPKSATSLV